MEINMQDNNFINIIRIFMVFVTVVICAASIALSAVTVTERSKPISQREKEVQIEDILIFFNGK